MHGDAAAQALGRDFGKRLPPRQQARLAASDDVAEAEVNPAIIGPEGAGVTVADAWVVRA